MSGLNLAAAMEALSRVLAEHYYIERWSGGEASCTCRQWVESVQRKPYTTWAQHVADAIIAGEVRPHGTVTDAESAWEYGVRHVAVDGWPTERVHVSLEDARADLDTCGMNCHLIRRSGAQAAGKWHPIDYTGEVRP